MQAGGAEIANFLKGTGLTQQANLAQEFAKEGLPTQGNVVAQTGAQAGGMALGFGRSALDEQIAQRASEVGFAQKQPGFARRAGAANITTLNRDYANKLSDAIGGVTQNVPGMVNQAYQSLLDREFQKATAKKGFDLDKKKIDASNKKAAAGNAKIDTAVSNNANDGYARDSSGFPIPDGQGGFVPWTITTPKPPGSGGKPSTYPDRKLVAAEKEFFGIAKTARDKMIARLNPDKSKAPHDIPFVKGSGKATEYITAQREAVVNQIVALWQGRFPNMSTKNPKWLAARVASTLRQAGWNRDADIWEAASKGKGQPPVVSPGGPPPTKGGKPVTGGKPATTPVKPGKTPSSYPGVGATPSIGEPSPTRQRLLRGVTGRADALTRGGTDRYTAYGLMTNYILREGYSLGYNVNPRTAWLTAQRALEQSGYKYEKELGNPGLYQKGWRMWRPHKG